MDKTLLSQLRDIDGLDAIGIWPLAPGWWALLALLVVAIAAIRHYAHRPRKPKAPRPDWNAEKSALLDALRSETDVKKKAAALSSLLRQAAMKRHGRKACAGLEGTAWLAWLAEHDPAKFDWASQGRALLEAPYAPAGAVAGAEMDALVAAAEKWI
jgi:hypothetical protein